MNKRILQNTILGAIIGTSLLIHGAAQAGAASPIVITKSVCVPRIQGQSVGIGIQDLTNEAAAFLKESCEDRSGISTLNSFELIPDGSACGFGLQRYKYTLTAKCYVP